MGFWIRSQDKMALELVNRVEITHKLTDGKFGILDTPVKTEECIIWVNGRNFGEYKTEQRAIEILDKILKYLYSGFEHFVYEMPADEE